jgi:hypothetical protein
MRRRWGVGIVSTEEGNGLPRGFRRGGLSVVVCLSWFVDGVVMEVKSAEEVDVSRRAFRLARDLAMAVFFYFWGGLVVGWPVGWLRLREYLQEVTTYMPICCKPLCGKCSEGGGSSCVTEGFSMTQALCCGCLEMAPFGLRT